MDYGIFAEGLLPFYTEGECEEESFIEAVGQTAYNLMRLWQEEGNPRDVRALAYGCDYAHFTNNGLVPYIAEDAISLRRYDTRQERCDAAFNFSEMWQHYCQQILMED